MADKISLEGKVAIVTGAGAGLGRVHALLLASRGAKVVVNDLGGAMDGGGAGSAGPADKVVDEIKAAGGEAVADPNDVVNGEAIVKTAVDAFGTVDIVVNNAGILRDISFIKQEDKDWDLVMKVHLQGSRNVTKAAFPIMREKKWGRIIMTTSAAGLFGNFGQTNYSAAKLGILGLANTLQIEGAKYNIKTNTIAPLAGSRLTETVMPKNFIDALKPEYVAPLVCLLCSEQCPSTGAIYALGGGFFAKVAVLQGPGTFLDTSDGISPEAILDNWDAVANMEGAKEFKNAMEAGMPAMAKIGK
jgi:NAD(P)-dependent dehydrogenase (short-subunit alcohol dehydrogenase family)